MMTIEEHAVQGAEKLMLVDEQFATDEANDLLMNVLQAQINFYQIKDLRSYVRYGKEDKIARHQISVITETIEKCRGILEASKRANCPIAIKAELHVRLNDYNSGD